MLSSYLEMLEYKDTIVDGLNDPIDIAIIKYDMHPSILTMKKKVPINLQRFTFTQTDLTVMEKEIKALNVKKATTHNNIPITFDICSPILNEIWCEAFLHCNFPSKLKLADIISTYKGTDATSLKNYRPISI